MTQPSSNLFDLGESLSPKFPIHQEVSYKSRRRSGIPEVATGTTIYMSSHEIRFTTERSVPLGQKLEVTVNWPVMLDRTCHMKLVISGHVTKSDLDAAAVRIERYEFRTKAAAPLCSAAAANSRIA